MRRWGAICSAILWTLALEGSALSAINPASPGLAPAKAYGKVGIPNNGASALCVECHTENPKPATGTHFVVNTLTGQLRTTHSGGGWIQGAWGIRKQGEFFKVTAWAELDLGNGGSSKFGDTETWQSVIYADPAGVLGAESSRLEGSATKIASYELICESCHNLRVSVEGRYNLLAKSTDSTVIDDVVDGRTAPLCVGCHGFLYHDDAGAANGASQYWADSRNTNYITGGRRGNNEVHYINGKRYNRNHHVMTGDAIDLAQAQAGLLVRDVDTIDPNSIRAPMDRSLRTGSAPVRLIALAPIVMPSVPTSLHCLTCHAPGHGGERSMGAAVLRGDALNGSDKGFGIDRISDGNDWGRYSDERHCGRCHE